VKHQPTVLASHLQAPVSMTPAGWLAGELDAERLCRVALSEMQEEFATAEGAD
jgi:hypothetical protein